MTSQTIIRHTHAAAIAAILAALTMTAPAVAHAPRAKLVTTGPFTAAMTRCPAPDDACGGNIEFNGTNFGFDGGALKGTVSRAGIVSHGHLTFGAATTDPHVDGPLQLTFQPIAVGDVKGRFLVGGTPRGAQDANGLQFSMTTNVYFHITGSIPLQAASNYAGQSVGPDCTVASAAQPLAAEFKPTLAGFFGAGTAGAPYSQAHGTTSMAARWPSLPAAQNCQGLEDVVNEQLGLPGQGSLAVNLSFRPVLQTNLYRAHHHRR
jgi:hypothetical protein